MLHARAQGFLGRTYLLLQEDREVARIELGFFKEEGALVIGDVQRRLGRKKKRGIPETFMLEKDDGTIVVQATKPNYWKSQFLITYGEMEFELAKVSVWKPKFALSWNGEEAGTIYPTRWFSVRDVNIELPDVLPLEIQAFVLWLAIVQWMRDSASAG